MEALNMKCIIFAITLSSLRYVEAAAKSPAPAKAPSQKPDGTIKSFCSNTAFPSECIKSVTPLLSGKTVNGNSVLRAGIQSLIDKTNTAIDEFGKRRGEAIAKSSKYAERVDVCLAYYGVVTASSKNAAEAITAKNYMKLTAELQKAFKVIGDCDDLFAVSVKGRKGPLEDTNTWLRMVAKNNLGLVQHVLRGQ